MRGDDAAQLQLLVFLRSLLSKDYDAAQLQLLVFLPLLLSKDQPLDLQSDYFNHFAITIIFSFCYFFFC
jgi:hypothetical protein